MDEAQEGTGRRGLWGRIKRRPHKSAAAVAADGVNFTMNPLADPTSSSMIAAWGPEMDAATLQVRATPRPGRGGGPPQL